RAALPAGDGSAGADRRGPALCRRPSAGRDAGDRARYRLLVGAALGLPRPRHAAQFGGRGARQGADRRQHGRQGRLRHRGRAVPAGRIPDDHLRPRSHRAGAQARRIRGARPARAMRGLHARADGPRLRGTDMSERIGIEAVVFDLGGVLIDWNPRHLYRKLFADAGAMEDFLATVCTQEWNQEQDSGRRWDQAVALLVARYPQHRELIAAYHHRWEEMLAGSIADSVAVLSDLKAGGGRLYALTNWSAEKFGIARARFDFLAWFDDIVVSGEV